MLQYANSSSPILDSTVDQHVGNATQFLNAVRTLRFQMKSWDLFANLCNRCEANLDALRIIGSSVFNMLRGSLTDDVELAGVLALLLAETELGQPEAAAQAVSLLRHENPEIRRAAWWGLRFANPRNLENHLRALLGKSSWDFPSAAALDVLAFHRLPVHADLGRVAGDETEEVACLLAEAEGRTPGAWNAERFRQFLSHASAHVRESALRAAARCGIPELLATCRQATAECNPAALEAISFLGVVGSHEDLPSLQRAASNPPTAVAAVTGFGRLGLPASVLFLLDLLGKAEFAETAAAALQRITGRAVPRSAPPKPPQDMTEEERDLWEPIPPIDAGGARSWWEANRSHFDPHKRWQLGLPVSEDPLGLVFDRLPLAIRYDIYLRQRALVPGTPDWELETWAWKQRKPRAAD